MIFIRTLGSLYKYTCHYASFISILSLMITVCMHTSNHWQLFFLKSIGFKLRITKVATSKLLVATFVIGELNKPGPVRDKISSSHLSNPIFTNGNERSYPEVSEPPHPSLFDLAPDGVYQARMLPYGW